MFLVWKHAFTRKKSSLRSEKCQIAEMADVERRFHAFPSTLTAAFPPSDTRFLSALTLGVAYHGKHLTPASDLQRSFIQWCLLTWGGGGGVMW